MFVVAALALALAPEATPADPQRGLQQLVRSCDAHKFETVVKVTVNGRVQGKRVKICGVAGQSDADWLKTLKDAGSKVAANVAMPLAERDQLLRALSAEIAKVEGKLAVALPNSEGNFDLGLKKRTLPSSDRSDFSALPPLPPPVEASVAARAAVPTRPQLPPLRVRLSCTSAELLGIEEDCADVGSRTTFTIRPQEKVPAGTRVRFVRDGEERAELPLPSLAAGRSFSIAMPRKVCTRVARASLKVEIVRNAAGGAQVVADAGPFNLRCL